MRKRKLREQIIKERERESVNEGGKEDNLERKGGRERLTKSPKRKI